MVCELRNTIVNIFFHAIFVIDKFLFCVLSFNISVLFNCLKLRNYFLFINHSA